MKSKWTKKWKLVWIQTSLNKKNLIIFTSVIFLITLITCCLAFFHPSYDFYKGYYLAPSTVNYKNNSGSIGESWLSISDLTSNFIFAGGMSFIIGLISFYYIKKIFLDDIVGGQILFWSTLPFSRQTIYFKKLFCIYWFNIVMWLPTSLFLWLVALIARDGATWFANFFLDWLSFTMLLFFISTIIFLICFLSIEKTLLKNTLLTVWFTYIIGSWVLSIFIKQIPDTFKNLGFLKYLTIDFFIETTLNFSLIKTEVVEVWPNVTGLVTLTRSKYLGYSLLGLILKNLFLVASIGLFGYGSLWKYKHLNFYL